MSVVISMLVGSEFSNWILVRNSIQTIRKNIGASDYLLVIGIASHIDNFLSCKIKDLVGLDKRIIIVVGEHCETFALFTNYVIQEHSIGSKWFIIAHDDIKLKTEKFIPTVEKSLKSLSGDIGWISFTDDDYLNGNWAPSTRAGYHLDVLEEGAWYRRTVFQFHNLKDNWLDYNYNNLKYDYPSAPVKCHAPFSHFIMIETEKLNQIGLCENWSVVSLLIDEDWGLSAMKEGLSNIWIPQIIYTHCRTGDTRAIPIIRAKGEEVAKLFYNKWRFPHKPLARDIRRIRKRCKEVLWSFGKRSFEWEYI